MVYFIVGFMLFCLIGFVFLYNRLVLKRNKVKNAWSQIAIEMFPGNVIAGLFHFKGEGYMSVEDEHRENVNVFF